jgi:hypothetical protein
MEMPWSLLNETSIVNLVILGQWKDLTMTNNTHPIIIVVVWSLMHRIPYGCA